MALMLLSCSLPALAWGPEGHRVIGQAAFEMLHPAAREEVLAILGNPSPGELAPAFDTACNWPDAVRNEPEWKWSSPLHYVNIPRHSHGYDRERDCRDGLCVTEGILKYAQRLTLPETDAEKRWQDFAFVCHLVGDLHQPLHTGFRDDLGGNTVMIRYRGEEWNLHQFWDRAIVRERLDDESRWVERLAGGNEQALQTDWHPGEVKAWTDQSHAIAVESAYPAGETIDEAFADETWRLTQIQWERASIRLARILNTVLVKHP